MAKFNSGIKKIKKSTTTETVLGRKNSSSKERVMAPPASKTYVFSFNDAEVGEYQNVKPGTREKRDSDTVVVKIKETSNKATDKILYIHNPYKLGLLKAIGSGITTNDNGQEVLNVEKQSVSVLDSTDGRTFLVQDDSGIALLPTATRAKAQSFHSIHHHAEQWCKLYDFSKENEFLFSINPVAEEFEYAGIDGELVMVPGWELTYVNNMVAHKEAYAAYKEDRDVDSSLSGLLVTETEENVTEEVETEVDTEDDLLA